jgi:hypothetical protein
MLWILTLVVPDQRRFTRTYTHAKKRDSHTVLLLASYETNKVKYEHEKNK